ncbi:iron-sulfur cluster-binding protein [Desulfonatronum parangueonense]
MSELIPTEHTATEISPEPGCIETAVVALTRTDCSHDLENSLWLLDLQLPATFREGTGWQPGQFVMIRPVSWSFEPLWARPFSICMAGNGILRIFFQVVGKGTRAMTKLEPGEQVIVWGPLGNAFSLEPDTPTLLLAGGIGLAPFIGYAWAHPQPDLLFLLLGHRPSVSGYPLHLLPESVARDTARQRCEEDIACFVRDLESRIAEYARKNGLILACGPLPFLRAVQAMALHHRARTQLSLENRMACGIGACLGCVTNVAGQELPVKVCTQGPVFRAEDVQLEQTVIDRVKP